MMSVSAEAHRLLFSLSSAEAATIGILLGSWAGLLIAFILVARK
jgi:hypothetical protein